MAFTFNTGKSVFAAIERIAATSSKIEKESLLKEAGSSSSLFMRSVIAAYDPFRNYGISNAPQKTPGIAPGGNTLEEAAVWTTLDHLVDRTLSGNAARDKVQSMVDFLDEPSAEMFRRIVNKDMRAGFSEGTINKCFKGTIAEFPYMRCSLPAKRNMAKWDWSVGIITQEKADGMFANVNHDNQGTVWITSRSGSVLPAATLGIEDDIKKALLPGYQTHGELTVFEAGVLLPREKGNGVLNSLLSGGSLGADQQVVFEAWDQIPLDAVVPGGKHGIFYRARFALLAKQIINAQRAGIVSVRAIPTRIVKSKAEAYAHYRELLGKGKEGIVCKHPNAIWADNTSKDQVKLKLEVDVDLIVTAIVPGKPGGKAAGRAGSVTCLTSCGELKVDVTVKNEAMRDQIDANPTDWIGRILVVRSNAIMPVARGEVASLFLPRMVETTYRTDKTVADSFSQVQDQFAAALETA